MARPDNLRVFETPARCTGSFNCLSTPSTRIYPLPRVSLHFHKSTDPGAGPLGHCRGCTGTWTV
eukprot:2997599-Rhodomonas_salina.3